MAASIFATMTTLFAGPEAAFDWKLLQRFWETLAQTGTPVSLDALAQALHCTHSKVAEVLRLYPEAEYDPSGNLIGLNLTLQPTVHQLFLENRLFYTWCAPDALHVPVVLGRPARIVSACPVTGTRIEVTLTPDHLESLTPPSAVVSIAKDGGWLKKLKETGCIRQGGCASQFFFASQEVVAPWVCEHKEVTTMWEFLQTYGIWILFGILFLLMMRMHSGGMHGMGGGCGMGHNQYDEPSDRKRAVPLDEYTDTQRAVPLDAGYSDAQRSAMIPGEYPDDQCRTLVREIPAEEENATRGRYPTKRHSGC